MGGILLRALGDHLDLIVKVCFLQGLPKPQIACMALGKAGDPVIRGIGQLAVFHQEVLLAGSGLAAVAAVDGD